MCAVDPSDATQNLAHREIRLVIDAQLSRIFTNLNKRIIAKLKEYLADEGFDLEICHEGIAGSEKALSQEHDLIILDVMLPGCSGFEVLKKIRKQNSSMEPSRWCVDDVELELNTRRVFKQGRIIALTAVEFNLLKVLLRSAGTVVSREELNHTVLGRSYSPYDRSIDVHVSKLRKKLGEKVGQAERIQAIRGEGYFKGTPTKGCSAMWPMNCGHLSPGSMWHWKSPGSMEMNKWRGSWIVSAPKHNSSAI
jgi:two-component system, OmpR family, response regulator CpxR